MGFSEGIRHFIQALRLVLRDQEVRRWYRRRLTRALLLATVLLFTVILIMGSLTYALAGWIPTMIPFDWLSHLAVVAVGVIAIVVIYFSAGPLSLLFIGVYLSQVGDWAELRLALKKPLPEFVGKTALITDIANTILLSLLILGMSVLALIPIFSFFSLVASAYALGRDWTWTVDGLMDEPKRVRVGMGYALGLGLIPAFVASVPFVGVAVLPILQLACLRRYSEEDF